MDAGDKLGALVQLGLGIILRIVESLGKGIVFGLVRVGCIIKTRCKLSLIAQILVTANEQVPYFICTGCNFSTCTRLTAFCHFINLIQHIKYLLGRMPARFISQRPLA